MTELTPEPRFETPEEELKWLKSAIREWKRMKHVLSADVILEDYERRYRELINKHRAK